MNDMAIIKVNTKVNGSIYDSKAKQIKNEEVEQIASCKSHIRSTFNEALSL